ncbi:sulfurtransferase [Rothia sp. AR01]|uniref:Sulfurtransferase n=1 Tax=Rothia santali TaxID=2949643 RepID=A0A9X2HE39_9MICC|nr:sulfurtransferase [Rothia santali]MCP3426600.1 sulfurtransferase [Rothia santali]
MSLNFPWIVSVDQLDRLAPAPGPASDPAVGAPDAVGSGGEATDAPVPSGGAPHAGREATDPVRVVDVRWYLDGRSGAAAYERGHIPGAAFVDLDTVLAAPASPAEGRHPLPDPADFARGMEAAGITDRTRVIAYDDASGASASRLVWMLRATGRTAAVLDGGIQAWTEAHGEDALRSGPEEIAPAAPGGFTPVAVHPGWLASMEETAAAAASGEPVVDARAPERYRGETEPMDPRAGHIPGALNVFHRENVGADGLFDSPAGISRRFAEAGVAGDAAPIVYCGSGVTACHDLVALEAAGIHGRLYPGSWSQYAATDRPLET